MKRDDILGKLIKFIRKKDWLPTNSSVICEKHFKDIYLKRGKRTTLNWEMNPVPTIHNSEALQRPANFPEIKYLRKPPKIRNILPDQKPEFDAIDLIKSFDKIDPIKHCPEGYKGKRNTSSVLFYRTDFDETGFPSISAAILINSNLHVKL